MRGFFFLSLRTWSVIVCLLDLVGVVAAPENDEVEHALVIFCICLNVLRDALTVFFHSLSSVWEIKLYPVSAPIFADVSDETVSVLSCSKKIAVAESIVISGE